MKYNDLQIIGYHTTYLIIHMVLSKEKFKFTYYKSKKSHNYKLENNYILKCQN